ncbi:Uncharacterised protein [Escherichia coli]|nr:Uncharacterised protein [Escherichia coli]
MACQADAAVGRGDIAPPLNADTVPPRLGSTVEADIAAGRGQGIGALEIDTSTICAVTCQADAAIGRIQGISAVAQLETCTICAVACQTDAAIGRIQGVGAVQLEANARGIATRQDDVMGGHQCDVIQVRTIRRGIQREVTRSDVRVCDIYAATVEGDITDLATT